MRINWMALTEHLIRALTRLYPRPFKARFGPEMLQVYQAMIRQVETDAGSGTMLALWVQIAMDGLRSAIIQWVQHVSSKRMAMMNPSLIDASDGSMPLTPRQVLAAVFPFLLYGTASLANQLVEPAATQVSTWQIALTNPFLLANWGMLVGLFAGIVRGFPRWTFSYLGWALFNTWWMTDTRINGYDLKGQIWIALGAVVIAALVMRRSMQPVRSMVGGLWRDLTLLGLGVYILYASVYMLADSNHHPDLALFITATTLAVTAGAWGYFTSAFPLRRVLWLTGGLAAAVALNIWNSLTWDSSAYYGFPAGSAMDSVRVGLIFMMLISLVMLGVGWLTQRRGRLRR